MKVKELMIGDWVMCPQCVGKVTGLYLAYHPICVNNYEYNEDCIHPIPLTEEMLKLNGFKEEPLSETMADYLNYDHRLHLSFEDNTDFGIIVIKEFYDIKLRNKDFNLLPIHVTAKATYVHEFQHALRLCGLNELADNFKIE